MNLNNKIKNMSNRTISNKLLIFEISILIFIGILILVVPAMNYSLNVPFSDVALTLINILILINICIIMATRRTLEALIPLFISFIPIVVGYIFAIQSKTYISHDQLGMPLLGIERPFYELGTTLVNTGIFMMLITSAFNLFKPIFTKKKAILH